MSVGQLVLNYIEAGDHRVMNRMHAWRAPRWIRLWMLLATRGGDGWLWYSLCLILLIFGGERRFIAVGAAAIASSLGIAVFLFLKRAFGRKRPCYIQPHCWATLLPPDQFSFPSGHTISAFAVAVPIAIVYPFLAVPLLFAALSIAISRVVLGMHFLSDVLAGIALGSLLGYLSLTTIA